MLNLYRRFHCWLFGHEVKVITGRLKTHQGDWTTWHCYYCKASWSVPIPNHQVNL